MASRNFQQFQGSLERGVVKLFAKVGFASGVASIQMGRGIKSMAKNGTGKYDIVLGTNAPSAVDKYPRLLGVQASFLTASGLPAAPICTVTASSVAADGKLTIAFSTNSDTPALLDPADTDTLLLEITLANTDAY